MSLLVRLPACLAATLLLAAAGAVTPACAEPVVVLEAQNGGAVEVARDRPLEVRLPAQFGSGSSWGLVRLGDGVLRLAGCTTQQDPAEPGATEVQVFIFQALAPGEVEIALDYRRPWDAATPPERTFALKVTVRE